MAFRQNFELARERITIMGAIVGEVVGSTLLDIFYWTVLVFFALGARLGDDPLRRTPSEETHWLSRDPVANQLDRAKRQG
jgi:hypothetical protein